MMSKADVRGLIYIVLFSMGTAFLYNHYSASGIAFFGQWDRSQGVVTAKSRNGVVHPEREINDWQVMKAIVDEKILVIADVRSDKAYAAGHIPGALTLPLNRFDDVIGDFLESYPPDSTFVLYCSGRECLESHEFADKLYDLGYLNVKVYSGGFLEWKEKGMNINTGNQ